jgi:hypothetical protein
MREDWSEEGLVAGARNQLDLASIVFTGIPADRCEEFWDRVKPIL